MSENPIQKEEKECFVVLCTMPNQITADDLAHQLLVNKLAACVTLFPGVTSFYRWNNGLEKKTEVQLLIKSYVQLQEELFSYIKHHHPYKVPELLGFTVSSVDDDYSCWLRESLCSHSQ